MFWMSPLRPVTTSSSHTEPCSLNTPAWRELHQADRARAGGGAPGEVEGAQARQLAQRGGEPRVGHTARLRQVQGEPVAVDQPS
jgi:hypothetical protein